MTGWKEVIWETQPGDLCCPFVVDEEKRCDLLKREPDKPDGINNRLGMSNSFCSSVSHVKLLFLSCFLYLFS